MRLGYTIAAARGDTNLLLAEVASALCAQGLRLAGTVQIDTALPGSEHCEMDLRLLPRGPLLRISQRLGAAAQGCRLDPSALEEAVARSEAQLRDGADLLVVNKFGKMEAEGRGFRPLIAEALMAGVPVLMGVNPGHLDAFLAFAGDAAERLQPDPGALCRWSLEARAAA